VRFLIDSTNDARAVAFYEREGGPIALTSTVMLCEVYSRGYYYRLSDAKRALSWVFPIDVTDEVAAVVAALKRRSKVLNGADVLIATTALFHDVPVVTVDSDFERMPDLRGRSYGPSSRSSALTVRSLLTLPVFNVPVGSNSRI
jgi:predicted nucleic acid-binding protein